MARNVSAIDSRPLAGMLWMAMTSLCFVGVQATVKHLGPRVPPIEAAFLSYLMGFLFLLPAVPSIRRARIPARAWRLFALRGVTQGVAVMCWFFAMTRITLAEVTAMNYLNPIYIMIAAVVLFGEPLSTRRLATIAVAFSGVLVILRPGFRTLDVGHIAMIVTALGFAASYLIAKLMTDQLGPPIVVAMMSVMVTIVLAPFAATVWVTPEWGDLAWLLLVAGFATGGHYAMTLAFQAAPMRITQPVACLQLLWACLLGALVFGEPLDGWVMLGGAMIVGSVSFIAWRESRPRAPLAQPSLQAG